MRRSVLIGILLCSLAPAQPSERLQSMLQRIFASNEFGPAPRGRRDPSGGARWIENGKAYSTIEAAAGGSGREIVRYDPATGKRDVLVSVAQLTPKQTGKPLDIADYVWSADGKKLMVLADRHTVLIRKPAGAYWVMDRAPGSWRQLGGDKGSDL